MPIRVAVVEDNGPLLASLGQLLAVSEGLECVGTFSDAEDFLKQAKKLRPNVVLMDIGLPGMSGIEALARLNESLRDVEVLMLTVYEDDKKIFDALCMGAAGYLLKRTQPDRIVDAIKDIHRGGTPMSPEVARRVVTRFRNAAPGSDVSTRLSSRERDVLDGLVDGLSYKMIADRLSVSIDTVRSHIKHIYDKLHINSKAEAIAMALKHKRSRY